MSNNTVYPVSRTIHMCVNIEGAIRNKSWSMFTQYNGHNKRMIEKMLRYELAMGRRVLPIGECDNFDYQEGCKGHPHPEALASVEANKHERELRGEE